MFFVQHYHLMFILESSRAKLDSWVGCIQPTSRQLAARWRVCSNAV